MFAAAVVAGIGTIVHAEQNGLSAGSLIGRPAPRLEPGLAIGPRLPVPGGGSAVLLFFWAHWCPHCKAEGPIVAKIFDQYRARGLALVAPTKRYGYITDGRPAAPDKELRHIADVRSTSYNFLERVPVPVSESNYAAYGVDAVPTLVLIDRRGIVRLSHAGPITEAELEAAIVEALER